MTSDSTIHDVTAFWLAHLELADEVLVAESDDHLTVKVKVKPPGAKDARALPDLGFGVSQVLPVIVAGLHLSGDALYVVELPEAQLHPFAQARLADFFCALVKRGGRVLIETHSEALFHRLRLRAALDRELASKTAIWFIDRPGPDGLCMQPKQVRLDDELHWPEGFLSDALNEELLMRHVRAARAQSAPADENEKPTP